MEVDPEFAAKLGEELASQMDEQRAAEASTRKAMEDAQNQFAEAREALMAGFIGKREQPQIPQPIQEIVALLQQQPRLIEPTQRFLATAVARINTAVNGIFEDLLRQEDASTTPTE